MYLGLLSPMSSMMPGIHLCLRSMVMSEAVSGVIVDVSALLHLRVACKVTPSATVCDAISCTCYYKLDIDD